LRVSLESGPPPSSPKPYWSAAKIIALVLVILVVTFGGAAGLYYYANRVASTSNLPCNNGASNPPTCTVYFTDVSLGCTAQPSFYNESGSGPFGAYCTATVSGVTVPTGTIGWKCAGNDNPTLPCFGDRTCTVAGTSASTSQCSNTITPYSGSFPLYYRTMTVSANYEGDITHLSSSDSFTMTAAPNVTLSGTAKAQNSCQGCSVTAVSFSPVGTGNIYYASITSETYFNITLSNFKEYNVGVYWSGTFGDGYCSRSLILYQFGDTANAVFQCPA